MYKKRKNILELNAQEIKKFFLKPTSYCCIDIPQYYNFNNLLIAIDNFLSSNRLSDVSCKPYEYENVNYKILQNKDSYYAWRPLEILNPVIYVDLVNTIFQEDNWNLLLTRFNEFNENKKISCLSMPTVGTKKEQILSWWEQVEQKSIELSLDYEYLIKTDIIHCYDSIYTHSISWAIHGLEEAKTRKKDRSLLGNLIDEKIRNMTYGQTNGLPQGSVLMDFIAEMVLGYADLRLSECLSANNIDDYQILRYRDDYRIFSNNPQTAEKVIKCLTENLIELGLKLNPSKTSYSDDVVTSSLKTDKLYWLLHENYKKDFQHDLLLIKDFSLKHPNSGQLRKMLSQYYEKIHSPKTVKTPSILISIIADIAYNNPNVFPESSAIISKLLNCLTTKAEKIEKLQKIKKKFDKKANTEFLDIWLQRASLKIDDEIKYSAKLCETYYDETFSIWENSWITCSELKNIFSSYPIFDKDVLNNMDTILDIQEISTFYKKYN